MTEDLYTSSDIKRVRELLLTEQFYRCLLSDIEFDAKDFHLDHSHDDQQLVRGALYKQSNMMLGKIENLYNRYIKYWYPHDLPTFLRQTAKYLERPTDTRFRHNGWIKKASTEFNKLNEQQKKQVLLALGQPEGKNSTERKQLFKKAVLTRQHGFDTIISMINNQKGH